MDPYDPARWHDFFLATSGAAAALAGLLFVALSLHMQLIASQAVYRDMARGSLIGLVTVLVQSLMVLVSQPPSWLATEFALFGLMYLALVGGYQLVTWRRTRREIPAESVIRSLGGYALGAIGLATGIGMIVKDGPGLYVIAIIVVVVMLWSLQNAWVLVVGVADEEIEGGTKPA